jgi:hypothetical protein
MLLPISKRATDEGSGAALFVAGLAVELEAGSNLEAAIAHVVETLDGVPSAHLKREISRELLSLQSPDLARLVSVFGGSKTASRAAYLMQNSIRARDETTRHRNLERATEIVLEEIRRSTETFVARIRLKILALYGLGILAPLILVGLLPAWSMLGGIFNFGGVAIAYCVVLPLVIFIITERVVGERPSVIDPPRIVLSRTGPAKLVVLLLHLAGSGVLLGIGMKDQLWILVLGASLYLLWGVRVPYAKRKEYDELESELPDVLLEMGGMLKEKLPVEEVLERAASAREGTAFAKLLRRVRAAKLFGTQSTALLGELQCPLRVRRYLQLVFALARKSSEAAGECAVRIAGHLKKLEEIKHHVRASLQELTGSMRSVAFLFAPLAMAVTARIYEFTERHGSLFAPGALDPMAALATLGLYSLILSALLLNFAVGLEFGKDPVLRRVLIGLGMPVTLSVFTIAWVAGGFLFGFIIG